MDWIDVVLWVLNIALFGGTVLLFARLGIFFVNVPRGNVMAITAGETLREIVPNAGNFKLSKNGDVDGHRWLVPVKEQDPKKNEKERLDALFRRAQWGTRWLQRILWRWGVYVIPFIWPYTRPHKIDLGKDGRKMLRSRSEAGEGALLRARVVNSPASEESTVVDSLRFAAPRPIYIEGLELPGDNSKINVLLLVTFRLVVPVVPIYDLKGEFFPLLDGAVEGAMVDFTSTHTVTETNADGDEIEVPLNYARWLRLDKAGEDSLIARHVLRLNISPAYLARLEKDRNDELVGYARDDLMPTKASGSNPPLSEKLMNAIQQGIVPRFGYAVVNCRLVDWEASAETKKLAESALEQQTQKNLADGVRAKADGERDAKIANATGDASLVDQFMQAMKKHGVDSNVAATVLGTKIRTENVGGGKITTYVEGGASSSVMVQAQSPIPAPTPPTTQPK